MLYRATIDEFEEWARHKDFFNPDTRDGAYISNTMQIAWMAWRDSYLYYVERRVPV